MWRWSCHQENPLDSIFPDRRWLAPGSRCMGYSGCTSKIISYWSFYLLCCQDSNRIQQCFSSEHKATLWHALPLIEDLQDHWEKNVMAKQAMNASLCTVLLSKMDSTSSRNTTASLMRSLLMFSLCICPWNSLISFTKQFKLFVLQSFTCILSLNTLNWHGVENQNKQLSEQRGFWTWETGKMRRCRFSSKRYVWSYLTLYNHTITRNL